MKYFKITAKTAQEAAQKYIKEKEDEYIKCICEEIMHDASCGATAYSTKSVSDEKYITKDYLINKVKPYFEAKGFTVKENKFMDFFWLTIIWGINK